MCPPPAATFEWPTPPSNFSPLPRNHRLRKGNPKAKIPKTLFSRARVVAYALRCGYDGKTLSRHIMKTSLAPSTKQRWLSALDWVTPHGTFLDETSSARRLESLGYMQRAAPPMTLEHMQKAQTIPHTASRLAITFGLVSASRLIDIRRVRTTHVVQPVQDGPIYIRAASAKSRLKPVKWIPRTPLLDELWSFLRPYARSVEALRWKRGSGRPLFDTTRLLSWLKWISNELTGNSMRTGGATLISRVAPMEAVQRLLGHQSIETTRGYVFPLPDQLENAELIRGLMEIM